MFPIISKVNFFHSSPGFTKAAISKPYTMRYASAPILKLRHREIGQGAIAEWLWWVIFTGKGFGFESSLQRWKSFFWQEKLPSLLKGAALHCRWHMDPFIDKEKTKWHIAPADSKMLFKLKWNSLFWNFYRLMFFGYFCNTPKPVFLRHCPVVGDGTHL